MPKNPLTSINIVTFNGERYIRKCLESVANQVYKDIEVNILDNNSQDNTIEIIKNFKLQTTHYSLQTNIGFAKAHNILIEKSGGEYILMLNQDAWLDKDYIKNALEIFKKYGKIAGIQPKIYRYNFEEDKIVMRNGKPIIDTTGLLVLKNRRIIARGQGEEDNGQFNKEEEIFGADGAAPIFLKKALEDVKIPNPYTLNPKPSYEYFDEDFFMYKEDVDLSWRLRLYGWKILYNSALIAYHSRGSGESAAVNYLDIIKERRHISALAKSLSWRNQRLMQVKNEFAVSYIRDFPFIFVKEIASLFYILLFERFALSLIKDFFYLLPRAMKKRRVIMAHRKTNHNELHIWFH